MFQLCTLAESQGTYRSSSDGSMFLDLTHTLDPTLSNFIVCFGPAPGGCQYEPPLPYFVGLDSGQSNPSHMSLT